MYNEKMIEPKGYQKLVVWQRAKEMVILIYKLTGGFPKSEMFGLRSQMTRAAVSVVSNIAEGYSRKSTKDKKRFLEMAIGSLFELESDIEISRELEFISLRKYEVLDKER